jgi:Lantibiotic biosynthesis dehydratase C-term
MTVHKRLLVDLFDPLIHDTFAGRVAVWFFGWYAPPQPHHLRLRILWQTLEQSDDDRAELFALLNAAQDEGRLATWWEGSHGTAGEIYEGEADAYGDLWELSYKDWNSSSELVLAMVKRDPDNRSAPDRQAQWSRRAHLHSNRLGWNYYAEAFVSLLHARGYLTEAGKGSQQLADFVGPMDQTMQQLLEQLAQGPSSGQ